MATLLIYTVHVATLLSGRLSLCICKIVFMYFFNFFISWHTFEFFLCVFFYLCFLRLNHSLCCPLIAPDSFDMSVLHLYAHSSVKNPLSTHLHPAHMSLSTVFIPKGHWYIWIWYVISTCGFELSLRCDRDTSLGW